MQYVEQQTARLKQTNPEHRHCGCWHIIRELTSTNTVPYSKVPGGTTEQWLNIWLDYSKSLLGFEKPTPFFNQYLADNLPIGCKPSVWKIPYLHEDFLSFCNNVTIDGNIPKAWTTTNPNQSPIAETPREVIGLWLKQDQHFHYPCSLKR